MDDAAPEPMLPESGGGTAPGGEPMSNGRTASPSSEGDRGAAFAAEVDALKLKGSGAGNERLLLALGVLGLIGGLTLTILGGIQVSNNTAPADQRAFMATGSFLGIALLIGGAAVFIRYSIARYLRFWLIRLVHESRTNTDRIVEAIERNGR